MTVPQDPFVRREQLRSALSTVRARTARACDAAGRRPEEVTLVVVTKTYPVTDIHHLAALGVVDVGEARVGEGADKVAQCSHLPLRWHAIGQVQTKKAGALARWADVVHSADRRRLVDSLGRGALASDRCVEVLVQVSLDGDPGRGGAPLHEVAALADTIASTPGLCLRGVMAIAPLGVEPAQAFSELAAVAQRVRADHPEAQVVSAGMSADLEEAVACGATHLRVGTAVLGSRPPLR